ncbi:MAG: 50S ribosomal protein L10 [Candidatus Dojkabacteria bacterium]|nr:MAG: 50S ribosomal protein L10 [Candidatus Dojkabacteria bacterium]
MPKNKAQKAELFSAYQDVVTKSNFIVIETNKVPARSITTLRKLLSEVDGKLFVIKNTVFAKAAEKDSQLAAQNFVGQLAVIEGGNDIVTAVKKLDDAVKDAKAQLSLTGADDDTVAKYVPFSYKFGYVSGSVLNDQDVARLSKLPDKQTILAQLVGTMAAPLTGLLNVMQGVPRAFVYAVSDLQNKKAE